MTAWWGEVLHQLDLLVGEQLYLVAVDPNHANECVILEHRHDEKGPCAAQLDEPDKHWISIDVSLLQPDVRNVQHLFRSGGAAQRHIRTGAQY